VWAEVAGKRTIFSDAPGLVLGGKATAARPIAEAPRFELRWNRIEPAVATMTNGDTPAEFRFAPIDYRATPIASAAGKPAIRADVRPTLTPDHGKGLGTMRYQIVALQGDRVIASAGPEARRGKGSGGLTDAVLRVSIRRDDSYLGYLTEMFGQPYIWASAGLSDRSHQSEHLEGSDCADLIVYGKRRMGIALPYTWTGGLPAHTKLLGAGTRGEDGIYRDRRGQPLPFTRPGDLVLFPRHVGALAVDRGVEGVLDDQDLMIHTLFDSPREQAIGETSYADKPVELRRFKR
jgi:cell wall-associated NlpC family hydrolase